MKKSITKKLYKWYYSTNREPSFIEVAILYLTSLLWLPAYYFEREVREPIFPRYSISSCFYLILMLIASTVYFIVQLFSKGFSETFSHLSIFTTPGLIFITLIIIGGLVVLHKQFK